MVVEDIGYSTFGRESPRAPSVVQHSQGSSPRLNYARSSFDQLSTPLTKEIALAVQRQGYAVGDNFGLCSPGLFPRAWIRVVNPEPALLSEADKMFGWRQNYGSPIGAHQMLATIVLYQVVDRFDGDFQKVENYVPLENPLVIIHGSHTVSQLKPLVAEIDRTLEGKVESVHLCIRDERKIHYVYEVPDY